MAGHLFANGKQGGIVDDRGKFYKALQRGPRGEREVAAAGAGGGNGRSGSGGAFVAEDVDVMRSKWLSFNDTTVEGFDPHSIDHM